MTTKYGDFVAPVFNAIGDKYDGKAHPDERDTGLAFKASVGKRGTVRCLPAAAFLLPTVALAGPCKLTRCLYRSQGVRDCDVQAGWGAG
jgi:hypothetical protein